MDRISWEKYQSRCLTAAKNWIAEDIRQHYTIEEIADQVGLNLEQLKVGFKAHYGMGPFAYLQQLRLETAIKLMEKNPEIGMLELAHAVGYSDARSLKKAFYSKFHTTPGKMREKIKATALRKEAQRRRSGKGYPLW